MSDFLSTKTPCASDPELFFPVAGEGTPVGDLQRAEAKDLCYTCPVASACLTWALESGQEYGVWGGMTEGERRALKRRKADPIPGPVAHAIEASHNGYGEKVTTLHTTTCKHVRRLSAERKRPVCADEVTAVWAAAFGGERGARFCRACKPWRAIPGLHEAEELYRPLPSNNDGGEVCGRCGHRSVSCVKCGAEHPRLGGRIYGVPYCHTHVEQPSCYTQELHERSMSAQRKTRVS